MLNSNLYPDPIVPKDMTQSTVPPPLAACLYDKLSAGQFLTPLHHAMASWHCCFRQGDNRVIIRFNNDYGAIISEYRLLEGIFEIAPLRFHGPGPDDHEFYFRSHVPDLTWCSEHEEMVRVCEQISRLLPPGLY
jgi:hypothetical protein